MQILGRGMLPADVAALEALFRNDLEEATRFVLPQLSASLDVAGVHLSGSGSTLFRYVGSPHDGDDSPRLDESFTRVSVRSRNR